MEFDLSSVSTAKKEKHWDAIVLGSGPAGLSSAIYAGRAKMKVLVLDKSAITGGQIATTYLVDDYPGIESIEGEELGRKMKAHAEKFGATVSLNEQITNVDLKNKTVETAKGKYSAESIIIATGSYWRELNVKGEKEFRGKGVSYCAVCDAPFFKDKDVIVVGGGNSALDESLYLSKFARKIHLVHRRDSFRADKITQERVLSNPKIEIIFNSEIKEISGKNEVESVKIFNSKINEEKEMKANGVFIYIGLIANTELFKGQIEMDEFGYIITDDSMQTNIEGVFAAGDCRKNPIKQAITAAGEGAIAGIMAEKYVEAKKHSSG